MGKDRRVWEMSPEKGGGATEGGYCIRNGGRAHVEKKMRGRPMTAAGCRQTMSDIW